MGEIPTAPSFRVSPYRFTDRPADVRRFLQDVGLRPVITKEDFARLRGAAGGVTVHPLDSAVTTVEATTTFCLETNDARDTAESLTRGGLPTRWWDESFGRQAAIAGPGAEIMVNEPMADAYGYTDHRPAEQPGSTRPDDFVVDVVAIFFTPHLENWQEFFERLGFAVAVADSGWIELRAGADSGVVGLHASAPADAWSAHAGISFKTSEPLGDFVPRMRELGYRVTEEPEAQAPHVTVIDPDGEAIEIHQR